MNLGKAREYFSAFYEGTLDRGLREGFERVLREDAQAQAEYRAFESTMRQLEAMKEVEVECPDDLHDRVMARIDRHIWEKNQTKRVGPFNWWKVFLPTVATAAVVVLALNPWKTPEKVNTGGVVPVRASQARLEVQAGQQSVIVSYPGVYQREVVIRDGKGNILEKLSLKDRGIEGKVLKNVGADATLLSINESDLGTTWIAIPGSEPKVVSKGEGSLQDMAMEIAGGCRIPVVLQVRSTQDELKWTLDSSDAVGTATKAVETLGLKVELRGDPSDLRTLWILGN